MVRQFQWKRPHIEIVSMHQRVEDNAFHVHFCELPGEIERAKLWSVAAPVLE